MWYILKDHLNLYRGESLSLNLIVPFAKQQFNTMACILHPKCYLWIFQITHTHICTIRSLKLSYLMEYYLNMLYYKFSCSEPIKLIIFHFYTFTSLFIYIIFYLLIGKRFHQFHHKKNYSYQTKNFKLSNFGLNFN